MTDRARYHFAVKEGSDGVPWIMLEPMDGNLPMLEKVIVGFDLIGGCSYDEAFEIARSMNDNLASLALTRL